VRTGGVGGRGRIVQVRAVANDAACTRVGLAVRGSSGAVQRNRARRRLREAARPAAMARPGHDLVLSGAAPLLLSTPFAELRGDVELALRRALGTNG
jgi:ribonuclease P protein component